MRLEVRRRPDLSTDQPWRWEMLVTDGETTTYRRGHAASAELAVQDAEDVYRATIHGA